MTEGPGAKDAPHTFTDEERARGQDVFGLGEVKRRQFKQALDAYEAAQREKARAGSDQASGDDGAPTAR
jgi:hypothetical protein